MPIIKLSNFDCNYEYQDFGKDKTLLLSNSLGTNLMMWDYQLTMLSDYFNILRTDTRGHGKSSIHQNTLSIDELGNDLIELMDALDLRKVHFCGLSMGGLIGQWLGIHHSSRFETIVISNTAAKIGTEEGWNNRIKEVNKYGLTSILKGTADRWFTPYFQLQNPDISSNILTTFQDQQVDAYIANCTAVRDANFSSQLYSISVPTLIISGMKDTVTTLTDGQALAINIPEARLVTINAAHLSNVECATEFSNHLINFSAQ